VVGGLRRARGGKILQGSRNKEKQQGRRDAFMGYATNIATEAVSAGDVGKEHLGMRSIGGGRKISAKKTVQEGLSKNYTKMENATGTRPNKMRRVGVKKG